MAQCKFLKKDLKITKKKFGCNVAQRIIKYNNITDANPYTIIVI